MTILVPGLISGDFPSDGSASDRLRGQARLCSLSGVSGLCQAEGVTLRDLSL
jgi:hypothetical protein